MLLALVMMRRKLNQVNRSFSFCFLAWLMFIPSSFSFFFFLVGNERNKDIERSLILDSPFSSLETLAREIMANTRGPFITSMFVFSLFLFLQIMDSIDIRIFYSP